ncbi:hypothetical protein CP533_0570, partial [Ophiocordyceps camponoti-saundersi (nom. inval.)]
QTFLKDKKDSSPTPKKPHLQTSVSRQVTMSPNAFYECGTCGKEFPEGREARWDHCSWAGHSWPDNECDSCHRYFSTWSACAQHMNDTAHWQRIIYDCQICDERFSSESDLTEHHHDMHNYCSDCERTFRNPNCLRMHLRSRQHMGTNVDCPYCPRSYVTATGLVHHVESGNCPGARCFDRDQIYRIIDFVDTDGLMCNRPHQWTGSYEYQVGERCYNGYSYECYLCNRQFDRLGQLEQHLNSPTHQEALYHCQNTRCDQQFKSLAGYINHLESEACGVTRFENIQGQVDDLLRGRKLLTLG